VGIDLPAGEQEVLHVMKTVAASYRIDVDVPALVVAAEPDSPIAMETWVTPLSRQPGEPVTLFAKFSGEIGSASVTAGAKECASCQSVRMSCCSTFRSPHPPQTCSSMCGFSVWTRSASRDARWNVKQPIPKWRTDNLVCPLSLPDRQDCLSSTHPSTDTTE
jgi:hypothetical protein